MVLILQRNFNLVTGAGNNARFVFGFVGRIGRVLGSGRHPVTSYSKKMDEYVYLKILLPTVHGGVDVPKAACILSGGGLPEASNHSMVSYGGFVFFQQQGFSKSHFKSSGLLA